MLKKVIAVAGMAITFAACAGCGGSSDLASEIRANSQQMLVAMKDDNLAKLCSYYVEKGKCVAGLGMAKAFLGGKLGDLLTEEEFKKAEKVIDTETIQVSQDGTRATVKPIGDESEEWVKSDGDWKMVWGTDSLKRIVLLRGGLATSPVF
jgi:hypothetical protein